MLHRVEMNIIHVRNKVGVVTNKVFSKSSLPNNTFTAIFSNLEKALGLRQAFRKSHLDQSPSDGEVRVIFGKFKHTMHVFPQHDPAMNTERMAGLHRGNDFSQQDNVSRE